MKKIIIEAYSPSHLFFFLPYVQSEIKHIELIWHGKKSFIDNLPKELVLPEHIYCYSPSSSIKSWRPSRSEANKYRGFLLSNFERNQDYIIYSPFNYGIYFEILKQTLLIDDESIILYDDGMAGFLPNKIKYKIFKELFYRYHGIVTSLPNHQLFATPSLNKGFSINPNLIYRGDNKNLLIKDISEDIAEFMEKVYLNNYVEELEDNSAIIATHHAIENNRMSENSYFLKIKEVINKIHELGINKIYFSMHHQEDHNKKYEQYKSLGMTPIKKQNIPLEVFCCSEELKLLAQPFNTIPFMASSLGLLNQKKVVSYHLDNMPLINERVLLIKKLLREQNIEHYLI